MLCMVYIVPVSSNLLYCSVSWVQNMMKTSKMQMIYKKISNIYIFIIV